MLLLPRQRSFQLGSFCNRTLRPRENPDERGDGTPPPRHGSDRFQIDRGRLAVLASLELVRELLVLAQAAEPGALDRRDVHEHVLGLVVRLDEPEPLAGIEKLYGTGRHGISPYMAPPSTKAC